MHPPEPTANPTEVASEGTPEAAPGLPAVLAAPPPAAPAQVGWRARLKAERRVAPEALNVAPALVGLPLGTPLRRAMALGVDLLLVAVLASASGFWLVAGLALVLLQLRFGPDADFGLPLRVAAPLRWLRSRPWAGWALAAAFLALAAWNTLGPGEGPTAPDAPAASAPDADREHDVEAALAKLDEALAQDGQAPLVRAAIEKARAEVALQAEQARPVDAAAAMASAASVAAGEPAEAASASASAAETRRLRLQVRQLKKQLADLRERKTIQARLKELWDELLDSVGVSFGWGFVYFSLLPAWWGGQTLGKKLFRLRTVELTGQPITVMRALKRYGGYVAALGTGGIGFLQILWDPNAQGLHDKAAHTVVLDLREPRQPAA